MRKSSLSTVIMVVVVLAAIFIYKQVFDVPEQPTVTEEPSRQVPEQKPADEVARTVVREASTPEESSATGISRVRALRSRPAAAPLIPRAEDKVEVPVILPQKEVVEPSVTERAVRQAEAAAPAAGPRMAKRAGLPEATGEPDICSVIGDRLRQGADVRRTVKTAIQIGYRACRVIACSIEAGAELEMVIAGAVDAGVAHDVVSRCALDAGADAGKIAAVLNRVSYSEVCYILPQNPETFEPPKTTVISPSRF